MTRNAQAKILSLLLQVHDIKFQAPTLEEKESWIKALNEGINRGKNKVFDEVRGNNFQTPVFLCLFSSMVPFAKSRTCVNNCSPHPSCMPAIVQGKRKVVCKVGQVPSLQSLGSEDFWEFPSPSGSGWCREAAAMLSCVELGCKLEGLIFPTLP